jgi:hypothetical protein
VSKLTKAQKLASDMSDQLIAKIAINPLLNAPGQKLDPATLFSTGKPGKTRVSVINFSGLPIRAGKISPINCKWLSSHLSENTRAKRPVFT